MGLRLWDKYISFWKTTFILYLHCPSYIFSITGPQTEQAYVTAASIFLNI